MDEVTKLESSITALIEVARDLNKEGKDTRSRQLSLAITKLEEAAHWLHNAVDEIPF